MTVSEIRDYLAQYCDEGKGHALVTVCDKGDNPLTDSLCIADAVFIESQSGDCTVVLQIG